MKSLHIAVIVLYATVLIQCQDFKNSSGKLLTELVSSADGANNIYEKILTDIHEEQQLDSLLLLHPEPLKDPKLEAIYQYPLPKVVITKHQRFGYKKKFNSNILVVLMITSQLDYDLMETAAQNLNYIRQSKILIIVINVTDHEGLKRDLMWFCQIHNMTNVLLKFDESPGNFQLMPYPSYHWQFRLTGEGVYYPTHWRNMKNATVVTYTDQTRPRSLLYEDAHGNLKLNGYVAKLVLLFAERYNAFLHMYYPLQVGNGTHFTVVNQMVEDKLLDIPMAQDAGGDDRWQNMSDFYEINQIPLIVPLAEPFTILEVFGILLNEYFFGIIIISSLALSVAHTLVDYSFDGLWQWLNIVINDKVLPGVMGQSFPVRAQTWNSLRIIYILIGFAGLNISTMFSANINTLFTSPPYHRQILTYDDLVRSPLKILINSNDAKLMVGWFDPFPNSVVYSKNASEVDEHVRNLNTSYCYYVPSAVWQQLRFLSAKTFYAPKDMMFFSMLPWGFKLQHNSPYKEPLNYLIHRVHATGLMQAWQQSTFADMLKLKYISMRVPNADNTRKVLSVNDLFWVWMIVVLGLASSSLVFLVELWCGRANRPAVE